MAFDYAARADLFMARSVISRRKPLEYRPFEYASEAIRYAMEELPSERLGGICMETEEQRFNGEGIRKLYESEAYPLDRRKVARRRMKPSNGRIAAPVVLRDGDGQ
jgi:Arc/MetJ-type ribon-helix-helix transcriptional regulator